MRGPLGAALLLPAVASAVLATATHAAGPGGLVNLERIAVRVETTADVGGLSAEIERRLADALRQAPRPAPQVDPSSPDVLRLTAGIRALSSRTLRGFYLPFSGTYAVGPVRHALDRRVTVGGTADVIATVWEDERQVARPWRAVAAEVRRAGDELVDAFLKAYRAAAP